MKRADRWLLAVALVVVDLVLFGVPLTALVLAWALIARPARVREWVDRLYEDD